MSKILGIIMMIGGAALLSFCLINLLVGCETWADEVCVTPGEFARMWWRF